MTTESRKSTLLPLTFDEILTTTRTIRRRFDLSRPVEREVINECLLLAQQAPQGGNREWWRFIVVEDPAIRAQLGDFYRQAVDGVFGGSIPETEEEALAWPGNAEGFGANRTWDDYRRMLDSIRALYDNIQHVPIHLIPCITTIPDDSPTRGDPAAGRWGSVIQGVWSFCLAARSRGLGTAWTTDHLKYEREIAELLGIPYDEYMQVALLPVGYTQGTKFKPGPRLPLEEIVYWNRWEQS